MMDELDRDKLSEVGQVTTPTHGAIGLDSNGPWEPGEWFNLTGLGHSGTRSPAASASARPGAVAWLVVLHDDASVAVAQHLSALW
jgi:hypothetical protein